MIALAGCNKQASSMMATHDGQYQYNATPAATDNTAKHKSKTQHTVHCPGRHDSEQSHSLLVDSQKELINLCRKLNKTADSQIVIVIASAAVNDGGLQRSK
jgi:hypothetical protein